MAEQEEERSLKIKKNVVFAAMIVFLLHILGIMVYHNIEGWSYLDSAYFVTATITTVGYGDIVPATSEGKIFAMIMSWLGISAAFFLIYSIAAYRERTVDRAVLNKLRMFAGMVSLRGGRYKGPPEKGKK